MKGWRDDYGEVVVEYSSDIPLTGTIVWEGEMSLSPDLLVRLREWQCRFDINFHHDRGWTNRVEREAWTRDAARLIADLRREVPRAIPLVVDLWPIEPARWWRLWR